MKAIVTGGLGFIGSYVVDGLVEQGVDVVVIDDLSTGTEDNRNPKAAYILKDILDVEVAVYDGCDWLFHLAALSRIQPSFDDPLSHERANVIAVMDLLMKLRGNRTLKKAVFSSSSSVYGNAKELPTTENAPPDPLSPYAIQKLAAERYWMVMGQHYGIDVVALRYFNPYGARSYSPKNPFNAYSSVVGIFAEQARSNLPLTITGDGHQKRDFVHVRDVARSNLLCATCDRSQGFYNIGSGSPISIVELARKFNHPYVFIPKRKGEAMITWADVSKAQRDLNWKAETTIDEGIRELCEG